ncbi:MAG: hypothetical protein ABL971_16070 [Vicinamibacterales bacterium]
MKDFSYILEKIECADFSSVPFRHVYIDSLFTDEHLLEIVRSPEVSLPPSRNDEELLGALVLNGYKAVHFPGCTTNLRSYLDWHRTRDRRMVENSSACEGFGMAFRLDEPRSPILKALKTFLEGDDFNRTIASKVGTSLDSCNVVNGIQKYLDGYEISPHPDTRRKAATFMVNINSAADSEFRDHHTRYMSLKKQRKYVQSFWEENTDFDRCWVPWNWCETQTIQRANNSMVLFSPTNETLHAIKASYDHLNGQRTQLYGNLWFKDTGKMQDVTWEDLDLRRERTALMAQRSSQRTALRRIAGAILPRSIKALIKDLLQVQ